MKKLYLTELEIGSIPREIKLISYGVTDTTKGPYILDEDSAKIVLSRFKSRGLQLFFDYNHNSLDPQTPEQGESAGWFKLELRQDGIWAVDIEWTEDAKSRIADRKYKYISPVIVLDDKNRVIRLINVALTNLPATDNLSPLTLEEEIEFKEEEKKIVVNTDTNPIHLKLSGDEMKQKLAVLDETMDFLTALGMHCSKALIANAGDEDMISLIDKIHGSVQKMSVLVKDCRMQLDPNGIYNARPESYYKFSDKTEELASLSEEVKSITGAEKFDEQVMVLKAHRDSIERIETLAEMNKSLQAEIVVLKERSARVEKEELISLAIRDMKLMPKLKDWAMTLSMDQLKAYVSAAPSISIGKISDNKVVEPTTFQVQVELTESDLKMIQEHGLDKVKFLEEKRKRFGK